MRQIRLYQLAETELREYALCQVIEEHIEPELSMYDLTWAGKSRSQVADQDLIFHLKNAGQPKTLKHSIDSGDILVIDERAYLLLPARYKRLWDFLPTGVATR